MELVCGPVSILFNPVRLSTIFRERLNDELKLELLESLPIVFEDFWDSF